MKSIQIQDIGLENEVNLCDSCAHSLPECESDNMIFGTGEGDDNVASCSAYKFNSPFQESKVVYVATVNKDLTEGRGSSRILCVSDSESAAKRIGKGKNVQGSNAYVEASLAFKVNFEWFARVDIVKPSNEDNRNDELIAKKLIAINKAKEAGLSDEEIKAISS